jgi:ABC-type sugar transport system permease subunit
LAGLGSISQELYEAAEIDGANTFQLFRYITLPLLSPVTFYLALIAFIGTFKAFNHIYVMRVPSALGTVDVASITVFDTFYKANQYGYAATQAIILFVIILSLTLVQNKVFGERVFYG